MDKTRTSIKGISTDLNDILRKRNTNQCCVFPEYL